MLSNEDAYLQVGYEDNGVLWKVHYRVVYDGLQIGGGLAYNTVKSEIPREGRDMLFVHQALRLYMHDVRRIQVYQARPDEMITESVDDFCSFEVGIARVVAVRHWVEKKGKQSKGAQLPGA
jgi:hypothetical protein